MNFHTPADAGNIIRTSGRLRENKLALVGGLNKLALVGGAEQACASWIFLVFHHFKEKYKAKTAAKIKINP